MSGSDDKSGLYSLSGFAYQIKVFFYYAMKLNDEKSIIGFELLDDISIKNINDYSTKDFTGLTKIENLTNSYSVIQVKYTKIKQDKTKKILLNWILALKNYSNIDKFILFTDEKYSNTNFINEVSAKDLYKYVLKDKKATIQSIKGKIKKLFYTEGKYKEFVKLFREIKTKSTFISEREIEDKIKEIASNHFKRQAVPEEIYCARLQSALKDITYNIFTKALEQEPYAITLSELNKIEEKIIQDTNEDMPIPLSYTEFKSNNAIDIEEYKEKREYKQLNYCDLPVTGIKRNLQQCCYYADYRYRILAMNKCKQVDDIETQSYENFERVKESLDYKKEDTPRNRLEETQKIKNDLLPRKELGLGSYIYLTKDKKIIGDNQISWKDDNE